MSNEALIKRRQSNRRTSYIDIGAFVAFVFFVLLLAGCGSTTTDAVDMIDIKQQIKAVSGPVVVADGQSREDALVERISHLEVAKLELETDIKVANLELKMERNSALQAKAYWCAGLSFLGALVLSGLGIWLGMKRLLIAGAVAAAAGAVCVAFAAVVPYLLWIGTVTGGLAVATVVVMLINRHRALRQVAAGVEELKTKVPEYKSIMRGHIDSFADNIIDRVRGVKKE